MIVITDTPGFLDLFKLRSADLIFQPLKSTTGEATYYVIKNRYGPNNVTCTQAQFEAYIIKYAE